MAVGTPVFWPASTAFTASGGFTFIDALHGATNNNGTEANIQFTVEQAGKYTGMYFNVSSNAQPSYIITFRVGGADGNETLSIGSSATGEFLDSTHSDSVSAGNLVCVHLEPGGSGTFSAVPYGIVFTPTNSANTVITYMCSGSTYASNTLQFQALAGGGANPSSTTEVPCELKVQAAATLQNLLVNVLTFTSSPVVTITSRVGAGAGNLTVTPSNTGSFLDTSHTDSISTGNLVDAAVNITSGASTFATNFQAVDSVSTAGVAQYCIAYPPGIGCNANATTYVTPGGRIRTGATESAQTCKTGTTFTASEFQVYPTANTVTANTTITFRVGSGNGNGTVTVGSSASGSWVTDSTHSDSVSPSTEIDYAVVAGATGTAITFGNMSFLATYAAAAAGSPFYPARLSLGSGGPYYQAGVNS